jgi:hypothetical protein
MPAPNFLIIGDVKAGSTSLNSYLKQHPDIFVPSELKELRYFSYDKENPYHVQAASARVKTFDEYLSYFDAAVANKAIGETSPCYLRSPTAAQRIRERLPNIKLVACLRNPAERLYSLYMMGYRGGTIKKSFAEHVFGQEAVWIKGNFYWPDLKRYFDLFEEEQIKIILFDDLKTKAEQTVKDLYGFLNVDDTFKPDFAVENKGGMPRNLYSHIFLVSSKRFLKKFYNPSPAFKRVWANIKAASLQEARIDPRTRVKILEVCREDILRTEELIKRDLSLWFR